MTVECASDIHDNGAPATEPPATATTSPYEYVSAVTIADCGIAGRGCGGLWGADCGDSSCYGVPLYRQYLTSTEYQQYLANPKGYQLPEIRMMGEGNGQRSTLTVNHGKYYINDRVSQTAQKNAGASNLNVYQANGVYHTFFVYAKPDTDQIFQIYVGTSLGSQPTVTPERVTVNDDAYSFKPVSGDAPFVTTSYNAGTGLVTVETNLQNYQSEFASSTPNFCQPQSFCSPDPKNNQSCVCTPGSQCVDDTICSWAIKDMDCPLNGCFGFSVTLPANFVADDGPPRLLASLPTTRTMPTTGTSPGIWQARRLPARNAPTLRLHSRSHLPAHGSSG